MICCYSISSYTKSKIFYENNSSSKKYRSSDLFLFHTTLQSHYGKATCKHKRKFAVFTMDDGYKDNLTNALPVFKKHNLPYTIFLATDFMEGKAILWWYVIEDLILGHDEIVLSNGMTIPTKTKHEKEDALSWSKINCICCQFWSLFFHIIILIGMLNARDWL